MAVTWTFRQRLNTETTPGNLLYLGSGVVLCPCLSGNVYKSTDSGKTWSLLSFINPKATFSFTSLARLKNDSELGIAYGEDVPGERGWFYKSVDGGLNWAETALGIMGGAPGPYYGGIACYLGNNVIGLTRTYGIQRSADYGANWAQIDYFPPEDSTWMTLLSLGGGIVIATSGVSFTEFISIWRSTDYGLTWTRVFQGNGLVAKAQDHCIIRLADGSLLAALNRIICRSTNDGENWAQISSWPTIIRWLMNPGGNIVYAITNNAHTLRSVDGGVTWVDEGQIDGETIGYRISRMEGTNYVANFTNARIYTTEILFPGKPTDLLCEGETNPTAVEVPNPALSAIYHGTEKGDHCQIQVNASSDFSGTEMWNSGKIEISDVSDNERCEDITYAGSTLTPGVTYYWRIKFWDDKGLEGAWSTEPAYFTIAEAPIIPPEREKPVDAVGKVKKARLPLFTRRRELIRARLLTPPTRVILDP